MTHDTNLKTRIERLEQSLGRFDPQLRDCQDTGHLSFSSQPSNVLLMAQELLKVKTRLKPGPRLLAISFTE